MEVVSLFASPRHPFDRDAATGQVSAKSLQSFRFMPNQTLDLRVGIEITKGDFNRNFHNGAHLVDTGMMSRVSKYARLLFASDCQFAIGDQLV
jgi:hypothetical protein